MKYPRIVFHVRVEALDALTCSVTCPGFAASGYDSGAKCTLFGADLGPRVGVEWRRCALCKLAESLAVSEAMRPCR